MDRREVRRLSRNPARQMLGLVDESDRSDRGVVVGVLIRRRGDRDVYVLVKDGGRRGGRWDFENRKAVGIWHMVGGPKVDEPERQCWVNVTVHGVGKLKELEREVQKYLDQGGKFELAVRRSHR